MKLLPGRAPSCIVNRAIVDSALLAALCALPLPGQAVTGAILGIVTDATGGSIPQAQVSIVNEATGQKRLLATNEDGSYLAAFLPVGNYAVSVSKTGFHKASYGGIIVQVDQ